MIFPEFKSVELEDKNTIEQITKKFKPYCDFNFANIYNWSSPKNPTAYSILNNNLVIKMKDFTSDNELISYMGDNQIVDTVAILLDHYPELTMVPEESISTDLLEDSRFIVQEDKNNKDYVLSFERTVKLRGRKFKSKRARVRKFLEMYPQHEVKTVDFTDRRIHKEIGELFIKWKELKDEETAETTEVDAEFDELEAIKRFMQSAHLYENIICIAIYDKSKMIGMTTNQPFNDEWIIGGFGKADFSYKGIFTYLEYITAKILYNMGYKLLNYEQDLGLPGLRKTKESWQPVDYLRKYIINSKIL